MENQSQYTFSGPPQTSQTPQPPKPPQPRPLPPIPVTKNRFFTFVFSLMPGAGQMYHGLMKKGISLMTLFFGVIALSTLTYLSAVLFVLPVIWFYSFFDTVNRMNMPIAEMRLLKDEWLFLGHSSSGDGRRSDLFESFMKTRHVILGAGLILIALWIILNLFFGEWYDATVWSLGGVISENTYYVIRRVVQTFPTLIIPLICILLGVKLIGGGKKEKSRKGSENADGDAQGM